MASPIDIFFTLLQLAPIFVLSINSKLSRGRFETPSGQAQKEEPESATSSSWA